MTAAVVFDLDGVILDSEHVWDEVREELARERGGRWSDRAQRDMMGMSSPEWSRYMHDVVGVPDPPDAINREVVRRMLERYTERLPLIDGAVQAVRRLAERRSVGLASSSNREIIERVLEVAGIAPLFRATVSSEEVARGKPAPDVYLEAARRLEVDPAGCAAVEDSSNGIRSARAAGMRVVAIPNPRYPPDPDAVEGADIVYTDVWVSMGDEENGRRAAFEPFRVDEALMERAPNARFLHCLPAHYGEEITENVLYGPQSAVWDQAENRLHAQKALMALVIR